jgi:ribosomal protein S18 acetylase RimI-like enzyme
VDPVVRPAEDRDCDDLTRLDDLARTAALQFRGGALLVHECPPVDAWHDTIADPTMRVFVGTLDGIVCGFLVLRLASDRGAIVRAFVEVEARELGLGDTLVEAAIGAVREAGLPGIEAVALPGDRATKNLYERAGLTARKITVYTALDRIGSE